MSGDADVKAGRVKELDVVELRTAAGRWPAGATGTAVEVFDSAVMVEFVHEETGRTEDLVTLPLDAVKVLPQYQQQHLLQF